MKCIHAIALLAFSATLSAGLAQETRSEMDTLREMRLAVQIHGIEGFLQKSRNEGWRAPHIYSAYWVEKLPPEQADRIKVEKERRRFGAALAFALDDAALKLVHHDASPQRKTQADQMLSIAEWIRTERGYGNLLLFNRAQNLAAIAYGHLIADTSYPLKDVQALKRRFLSEAEDLEFRAAVLNEEGPTPFTFTTNSSAADRSQELELFWGRNWQGMMNWAATNNIRHIPHNDKSFRDQLPPAWAFYCDDDGLPTSQSRTTAREWELKSHEPTCIFGTRSIIVKDTQQLLFVREQLGDLPTNAPSSYKPADDWTPTQAAFEKAWKPYEKSLGDVASGAATIYEAIKAESYFDFETSELLKNNSRPR